MSMPELTREERIAVLTKPYFGKIAEEARRMTASRCKILMPDGRWCVPSEIEAREVLVRDCLHICGVPPELRDAA
jgi:hypothetical protein